MNTTSHSALKAYSSVSVDSRVAGADPHRLIVLLYEGALAALARAKAHMARNEIAQKSKALSHAVSIINDGLRASLDMGQGGDIAANLDALYGYMGQQLLVANAKNQTELIDEVEKLLTDLKAAWESIGRMGGPNAPQPDQEPQVHRSGVSYGKV